MSGEDALGIDWMVMILMLSISGSSRIDQQLGKNISMNLVTELFNKIPYTMYPYDAIQFKEYNPHMPSQEVRKLKPACGRSGCVLRPNNKCVLDDNIPMQERILVPSPDPRYMMEDIGVASPLYDYCRMLGISNIYHLPIHLVPWTVPYPISVPWPVIEYGIVGNNRKMGYIIVQPGGKTKLYFYGQEEEEIILENVKDVAEVHNMGPRLLFSSPNRAVKISDTVIGTLHPNNSTHPLTRLYDAPTDTLQYFDPQLDKIITVKHEWVKDNVLPMCSKVLISPECIKKLSQHVGYDHCLVMGKIVPPRECNNFDDHGIWVAIEVRHTVGNLKDMPNADMITLKINPKYLRPFPSHFTHSSSVAKGIVKYSCKKRKHDEMDDSILVASFIYANKVTRG